MTTQPRDYDTNPPPMNPWQDDGDVQLYHGDALTILAGLPAGSVQTCVTSPPYWGLRDYGTGSWTGGVAGCDHVARVMRPSEHSTLEIAARRLQQLSLLA